MVRKLSRTGAIGSSLACPGASAKPIARPEPSTMTEALVEKPPRERPSASRWSRCAEDAAVKKYLVKLSADEREQLESLIHGGKHPAQKLTKARILLKVDVSPAGEAWSDSRIASALNTGLATIARTRRQLVEEGFEAVLERKHSPASARPRIFDRAGEAKLIALTCSEPPKGRARWTLRLLEDKVVELNIVERVSDNTIGRTLKKTFSNPP